MKITDKNLKKGSLLVMILVFGSIFLMILISFINSVIIQRKVVNLSYSKQKSTEIAEAGLNYYRWFLSHYPGDVTNGTNQPGPYVHKYKDPEGDYIGEFSLEINSNNYCGKTSAITVKSTAHTYDNLDVKSVVKATYKLPTVAEYSFITNSGVVYGADRDIFGPVHSNQGIKMEGSHNSTVSSGVSNWTCTSSYFCNPDQVVPGVFSTSGNATPGLFSFPVSPVDFSGLTIDLADMKSRAQNNGGIFYGPSGAFGYRVVFRDNQVDIYRVTSAPQYWAYSSYEGWHKEKNIANSFNLLATHNLDSSCPLLYFEDKVWLEGNINQKVSLAAANLSSGNKTNIVINNNITYQPNSNAGLLAIAKDDIDIGLVVPNDMTANGIFVAQNGRFGRNHYYANYLPTTYRPYVKRNSLTRFGSVVSNGRVGTKWGNSSGWLSGFNYRYTSFDVNQVNEPPPLTPETSDVYSLQDWRQDR